MSTSATKYTTPVTFCHSFRPPGPSATKHATPVTVLVRYNRGPRTARRSDSVRRRGFDATGVVGGAAVGEQRLTVGRMAELNCISARTLRIYDEKGLLKPAMRDEETGYRYYTLEQCATLDSIQQLQHVGLSLDEIGALLADHDTMRLYACLREKDEQADRTIAETMRIKYLISRLQMKCFMANAEHMLNTPSFETFPDRSAIKFELEEKNWISPEMTGEKALHLWQMALCDVKHRMLEMGYPDTYFGNVACCIPRDRLLAHDLTYTHALMFVDSRDTSLISRAETVPAGSYLTVMCNDTSDGERLAESEDLELMLDEISARGLTIAGDYIGEVVLGTDLFSFKGRSELIRMQIRTV